MSEDPFNLQRFVDAQHEVYPRALAELARGRKTSHWMWFVFPQLRGLGRSGTAQFYGIGSRDEACAYLRHPLLGARLRECVQALLALGTADPHAIFGSPDDMKLRSSLTLFAAIGPGDAGVEAALARFYPEGPDAHTLRLLD
ncbi:DUF1810 domain-containing protein [Bordetella genomosp. 13]|uniref:DUF1810 domain-containing protein n=1 Tax=Bordetella genomosp. 13 TaxID=463040 RepID=UPI0011AA998F|nr:DUF1810 domain-containing protein [Bordetella genomosp. 13]